MIFTTRIFGCSLIVGNLCLPYNRPPYLNRCASTQANVPPDPVSGLGFRVQGVGLKVCGCEG